LGLSILTIVDNDNLLKNLNLIKLNLIIEAKIASGALLPPWGKAGKGVNSITK
jgi:hypothetical protein